MTAEEGISEEGFEDETPVSSFMVEEEVSVTVSSVSAMTKERNGQLPSPMKDWDGYLTINMHRIVLFKFV